MKRIILCIADGLGISENKEGNAFLNADTPAFDKLFKEFPHSLLYASGNHVGLPDGQMGNSEVGHVTIGSGRVVNQPLEVINKAILNKSFFDNEKILEVMNFVKNNNSRLHIFGLLSDGGVHSHIKHIFALIDMAESLKLETYIHVFLDGRDVLFDSAIKYLDELSLYIKDKNCFIASISGRYYAMDREGMWDNTKLCYDALFNGVGPFCANYHDLIEESYSKGIYDEFIVPTIINHDGIVLEEDGLVIANFRPDRLNQLFSAVTNPMFSTFKVNKFNSIKCVSMMPISDNVKCDSAFLHDVVNNTLGEVLSFNGYRVLRIAEVSKFVHVTHFLDGDKDVNLIGTSKISIPKKDVKTYDLEPKMSAFEVTEKIEQVINDYDFIVVNYANCDMVGHTGNYEASKIAVSCVDSCIRHLYELCFNNDYLLIICADHGNVEQMVDSNGNICTTHTSNKVPLIVCDKGYQLIDGSLSDIAPSILSIMGIDVPNDMTGNIIINEKL